MIDLLGYLLKVSAGIGIVYLPYYLLLRSDPNLLIKRIYLLSGLAAAWIFPLIAFRKTGLITGFTPGFFIDPGLPADFSVPPGIPPAHSGFTLQWPQIATLIYGTGTVYILAGNLIRFLVWSRRWRRTEIKDGIAFTEDDHVFALFSRIFIPGKLKEEKEFDSILLHERAHVEQLHYLDLVLMEISLAMTWFNPFSWLISGMIKENHEHLADRKVLLAGTNPARYRALLLNQTLGVELFRMGNEFNHSLTRNRFNMMKKPMRSLRGILKIAVLAPLVLLFMGLATGMKTDQGPVKGKVIFSSTGEPAPGASVVIRGTTLGTVTDLQGKFKLQVERDPEIVISFVGYSTLTLKASSLSKKPLRLEEKTFELDPDKGTGLRIQKVENVSRDDMRFTAKTDNAAVFVVNGMVVDDLEDIDPEAIRELKVLKNPDSEIVRKYNAKGEVVLITLKEPESAAESSAEQGEETFFVVEDMPMFPGGKRVLRSYIKSHLEYPETARKKGFQGEVLVQFDVPPSGVLENFQIVQTSDESLNKAALDLFEGMPPWNPGKQRGKSVKVNVLVPVRFHTGME